MLNSTKTEVGIGLPIEGSVGPGSSDLLVESILYIAKHHGRTLSSTSLLSGLPLDAEGRLTPRLAEVAARKAGFAARIVKSPLGRIASFALPAVLFLREDAACVLLDVRDGECHVAHPSVEGGEQVMTQEDLARIYAGFVMYLVPEKKAELRTGQVAVRPSRRWLQDALLKNWWPYSQVLIAALPGTEVLRQMKNLAPEIPVVLLTICEENELLFQALAHGASAYVLKGSGPEELFLGMHYALKNEVFISPKLAQVIVSDYLLVNHHRNSLPPLHDLTAREKQIVQLIIEGKKSKEIAQLLYISIKTVNKHRSNILVKLGIHNLAELRQRKMYIFGGTDGPDSQLPLP